MQENSKTKLGYLIAFEGAEGSGKNTQANLCSELLSKYKIQNRVVKELRNTEAGRKIKSLLINKEEKLNLDSISRISLFAAARRELFAQIIKPNLAEGKTIIVSGYAFSTLAYQGFGDLEENWPSLDLIVDENKLVTENTMPDITFILNTTKENAYNTSKTGNNYCFKTTRDIEYFSRVVEGYEKIANKYKRKGAVLLPIDSIENVFEVQSAMLDYALLSKEAKQEISKAEKENNRQEIIHKRVFDSYEPMELFVSLLELKKACAAIKIKRLKD